MSAHAYVDGPGARAQRPSLDPASICATFAERFRVRLHEVALLRVEGAVLRFVFPAELRWGGDIPLSSSAQAARTARLRRPEISNLFNLVPHWRLFERIHTECAGGEMPQPIQKIMSVPAIDAADVLTGVIQVSRKADTAEAAGPDFTSADLTVLQNMASHVANLLPLLPIGERRPTGLRMCGPGQRL